MAAKPHVGDIGTVMQSLVKDQAGNIVNCASASSINMIFAKPDGSKLTKNAVFTTDGTDGYVQYVMSTGELNQAGMWRRQIYIVFGSTDFYSDISIFEVAPNL